eukprot:174751-Karenia_brevis.AAC.1
MADVLKKFAPQSPPEVRESAVHKLFSGGIEEEWQLIAAPRELLLELCPPKTCSKELTLVMH